MSTVLWLQKERRQKFIFGDILKLTKSTESGSGYTSSWNGSRIRVRIRTKISRIRNTGLWYTSMTFFKILFCRHRILMVSTTCNTRFLNIVIRPRYSTVKHFRACSASDVIVSLYAQPAIKYPLMLNQRWNLFRVCSAYFECRVWNGLGFLPMLSMLENCLLVGWACAQNLLLVGWACMKIGYSLAEHVRKLVTC